MSVPFHKKELCLGRKERVHGKTDAVAYQGEGFKPPPKFRSFDKVEPDCKLSRKCLVFLLQHPN